MHNYKQIMAWLSTNKDIHKTPQAIIYAKYAKAFPDSPMTHALFGRFMRSQHISRVSMVIRGVNYSRYDATGNSRLEYVPMTYKQPCDHCGGRGYIKVVDNIA